MSEKSEELMKLCRYCDSPMPMCEHGLRCRSCRSRKQKLYYIANRQMVLDRTSRYTKQNREIVYAKNRHRLAQYIQKQPLYQSFISARRRAKLKRLPFNIRYEDLPPHPATCPVLGIPLYYNSGKRTDNSPSLDRVIPVLGYVPGNVQIISYRANKLKNDASVSEMQMVINYMKAMRCP